MFDIGSKLKRSWTILWNYKVLWVFAFILAMFGGGTGSGSGFPASSGTGYRYNANNNPFQNGQFGYLGARLNDWAQQNLFPLFSTPEKAIHTAIWIGVGLFVFMVVVGLLTALVRYPTETAIIRMVDQHEQDGTKLKFKQGWKLGWNIRAFRIWVIDTIIAIPAILFIALIVGIGLFFFSAAVNNNQGALVGGAALFVTFFLLILPFSLFMALLGLLRQFIIRSAALDNTGIGESFRLGWSLMKHNFKNAFLTWLVTWGVGIGFGIASVIALIVLVPAYVIMAIPGAIVAAIPGGIAYGISTIFTSGFWAWVIAGLTAAPFFLLIMFSPAMLLGGLYSLYISNMWTLTYREMKAAGAVPPLPVVGAVVPPAVPE
jgi:hypothetical protein